MEDRSIDLHFTVSYRGKSLQLSVPARSTVGELGQKLVALTGVAPHTLKLMLPKRPPLQPMSEQHSSALLQQSGITEGLFVRMMGASTAEVAAVSQTSSKDRIRGFAEEEELARRRSSLGPSSISLPKGSYIFCDFRTLSLPGVELSPPASSALQIMHRLASDRGIIAIMEKHHWRVGVMTEMAPVGYVGVSPKCILGFNKNRGQEISLRLRTDDLRGFRKYESIKKTLLHELAHMVHDEHDEKFHALDKQLNQEAIALDWTKGKGQTWSGTKFETEEDEDAVDAGGVQTSRTQRLGGGNAGVQTSRGNRLGGGNEQAHYTNPRAAAAAAALRRYAANSAGPPGEATTSERVLPQSKPTRHAEADPDDKEIEAMAVIAEGSLNNRAGDPDDEVMKVVPEQVRRSEPDPDKSIDVTPSVAEVEMSPSCDEPDPDDLDETMAKGDEPDPDADPDEHGESVSRAAEPDPDDLDEKMASAGEPDPDDENEKLVRAAEPGPDEQYQTSPSHAESRRTASSLERLDVSSRIAPSQDGKSSCRKEGEPDPDDSGRNSCNSETFSPDLERTRKLPCSC